MCLFSTCSLDSDKKKSQCQKRERGQKEKVTETLSKTTENCGGHSPSRQSSKVWDSSKFSIISMWWINNKICPLISLIYKKKKKLKSSQSLQLHWQGCAGEAVSCQNQHTKPSIFRWWSPFTFTVVYQNAYHAPLRVKKKDHFLTEWQIQCISIREREFDTQCSVITCKLFFNNTSEI